MKLFNSILIILFVATTSFALDVQSMLADGWRHFNNKNFKIAAKTFENSARIYPSSAEAYKGIGMSYMKMGCTENSTDSDMVQKAAQAFDKALQLDPKMSDVRYQLGIACLALDDKSGAEKQFQALKQDNNPLSEQLMVKITAYKVPASYRYLYNEHNMAGDRIEALQDLSRKQKQAKIDEQNAIIAAQEAERAEKKRLISAIEEARDAARSAEASASNAEAAAEEANRRSSFQSHPHIPTGGHVTLSIGIEK